MQPLILKSNLTKPPRWYVATRYIRKVSASGMAYINASKKYDVTDQMEAILKAETGHVAGPDVPDEVIDQIEQSLMDGD